MKLILIMFSLTQYIPNILISTCNQYKITNEIFYVLSYAKTPKFGMYFTLTAHLNSN